MAPHVSLVLPARNEAGTIAEVVRRTAAAMTSAGWSHEILVVDSASSNGTAAVAASAGVPVQLLREPLPGKGRALTRGFAKAKGRVLAFIDTDLDLAPEDLPRLVSEVHRGATCAAAMKTGPVLRQRPLTRRVGSRAVNAVARRLCATPLLDHQTGLKAFDAAALRRILPNVRETGWLWDLEVLWRLSLAGARLTQVPVHLTGCRTGHIGGARQSVGAALQVFRLIHRLRSEAASAAPYLPLPYG